MKTVAALAAHPTVIPASRNGKLIGHVLRLSDYAPHTCASGSRPFLGHAFASVTTPALDECAASKGAAIDLF
jgi:hypothetical protein